jgi:hypothetical protein
VGTAVADTPLVLNLAMRLSMVVLVVAVTVLKGGISFAPVQPWSADRLLLSIAVGGVAFAAFLLYVWFLQNGTARAAASSGAVDRLKALLAKRPALLSEVNLEGEGLIHAAAVRGQLEVVRLLLASGVAVDARTAQGVTALHLAAAAGHLEVARELVAAGAAVNAVESLGVSPVEAAREGGHTSVAQLLLASSV